METGKNNRTLKLYVWEGVLTGYTDGVMFALAESSKQAREKILERASVWVKKTVQNELKSRPSCITEPRGFILWGGS